MDREMFREICRSRHLCWGTVLFEHMTPQVVRAIARAGFDWIWIDNEHSYHSYETIFKVVRTAEDVGVATLLRVAQAEYSLIARALDMAVTGVIVPRLETPEQARYVVDCARYPPIGRRGFGMRSSLFGKPRTTMRERIDDQNKRILVIQVESRLGVDNLEAMLDAAQGQVDAVVFGYSDFQMDIGKPDHPDDPEVTEAARRVAGICAERGISAGTPVGALDGARLFRDLGFNLITFGNDDVFLAQAAINAREALREVD